MAGREHCGEVCNGLVGDLESLAVDEQVLRADRTDPRQLGAFLCTGLGVVELDPGPDLHRLDLRNMIFRNRGGRDRLRFGLLLLDHALLHQTDEIAHDRRRCVVCGHRRGDSAGARERCERCSRDIDIGRRIRRRNLALEEGVELANHVVRVGILPANLAERLIHIVEHRRREILQAIHIGVGGLRQRAPGHRVGKPERLLPLDRFVALA